MLTVLFAVLGFIVLVGGECEMVEHWAISYVLTGSQEVPGLEWSYRVIKRLFEYSKK